MYALQSVCFVTVSDESRWQCQHINLIISDSYELTCRVCWLFREAAYNELKSLQFDSWIDHHHTRAVITEFTLFHTQSTLFSSVKLALEISPLGRVTTSIQLASVFLYKYMSTVDYVVLVSEVFVLIFLCCLTCNRCLLLTVMREKTGIEENLWNVIRMIVETVFFNTWCTLSSNLRYHYR